MDRTPGCFACSIHMEILQGAHLRDAISTITLQKSMLRSPAFSLNWATRTNQPISCQAVCQQRPHQTHMRRVGFIPLLLLAIGCVRGDQTIDGVHTTAVADWLRDHGLFPHDQNLSQHLDLGSVSLGRVHAAICCNIVVTSQCFLFQIRESQGRRWPSCASLGVGRSV